MRYLLCSLLIALSGGLLWQAVQIEGRAGVYPIVVTSAAVLFSLAYTLRQAILGGGIWPSGPSFAIALSSAPRVASFAVIWTVYVLVLPTVGFIIATWLALIASIGVVSRQFRLLDTVWTAVFVLVLAVLMKIVLYVPVPQGWLDEQLEIFIYSLR